MYPNGTSCVVRVRFAALSRTGSKTCFTRVEDDVDHQLSPDQLVDGGLPVEEELQESPEAFAGKNIRAVGECHFARPMKLP